MRKFAWFILLISFYSCDNHAFDSDKRQILAKDELRSIMHADRSLSVTGFSQDTLKSWRDSTFKHPINYTLDFVYRDSSGTLRKKQGIFTFSPGGQVIIDSRIIDRP